MPNVTFYFEVHQPYRIKRVMSFDHTEDFIDWEKNRAVFNKVAEKCYIPMTKLLIELSKKYPEFKTSFSFTGTFLEQAKAFRPEVISLFQELLDLGGMDILDETYYHSLSYLISKQEFISQINKHREEIWRVFKFKPKVFRNTEAMYSNDIAKTASQLGYKGIISEGWDKNLGWRSPNYVYTAPQSNISVLLRNYRLSDDIAFRFSSHDWKEFPLTTEKYSDWLSHNEGETVNLFMDYETFGEHQWQETGIFEFMRHLPERLINRGIGFNTVSETASIKPAGVFDAPDIISWADLDRDLSAWLGNRMQDAAFDKLKSMEDSVLSTGSQELIHKWRILQTSDNFYYMCTKWFADGDIHKYFNAYDSPYIAYINYMNVISHLDREIKTSLKRLGKLADTPA